MIIDQTTAANRIEYLKHLLELEQITSESNELRIGKLQDTLAIAIEQRDRLAEALREIADCDFVITLPDRMDAVRAIAREALGDIRWHKL
jgi:hypothetical protein